MHLQAWTTVKRTKERFLLKRGKSLKKKNFRKCISNAILTPAAKRIFLGMYSYRFKAREFELTSRLFVYEASKLLYFLEILYQDFYSRNNSLNENANPHEVVETNDFKTS